jgi:hypothetical protein
MLLLITRLGWRGPLNGLSRERRPSRLNTFHVFAVPGDILLAFHRSAMSSARQATVNSRNTSWSTLSVA